MTKRTTITLFGFLAMLAVVGCRGSHPQMVVNPAPPFAPRNPNVELPETQLTGLEPDYRKLPLLNPLAVDRSALTLPPSRGITEATCRQLAAARTPTAILLEREEGVPRVSMVGGRKAPKPTPDCEDLLREVRYFAAAESRNRSVSEALTSYYQLADATGRAELVRNSFEALDDARRMAQEAKSRGAIVDVGELDRQRASALALLGQAELGTKLLDIDLRRRLGVAAQTGELLRPTGDFAVPSDSVNCEAAIALALERRSDLLAIRTVYLKLSPENLEGVREYLRGLPTASGLIGFGPRLPVARRAMQRQLEEVAAVLATATTIELEIRRQQLWTLIEERERSVADEVRATTAALMEQTRQVALARWRAEQLIAKAEETKRDKGPFVGLPAMVEALRARSEVISAVMLWQQARVRLLAAQGVLVEGN